MKNPPNIVVVIADQLRYASCGYAGDANAKTPVMDEMARNGANVQNAVVSMPVCAAYRASFFTGKYATSTGMVINEIRLNPDHHKCFATCLTESGYNTGYIGKWHMYATDGNHHDPKGSHIPPGKHRLGFDGYWAGYNFHHWYQGEKSYYHTDSEERHLWGDGYEPDHQTDMAIEYLKEHSEDEDPFCLVLAVGTPHDPWMKENVPEKWHQKFESIDFPVPPNYKQENDTPYGDGWSNVDKSPAQLDEWQRVYYSMTANLDWNLGRLRQSIKDLNLAEDTIVLFTSDHGEQFGAHGRMKKNIFYDEAARVPFLIECPGTIPAQPIDVCMNNVDIMPTLLGLCDIPIPEDVEGMDLSSFLLGEKGDEPDFAFLQNTGACAIWEDGHEWRGVRDKRYTYATYLVDGKELLFDNILDPYQINNLIDDENHASIKEHLKNGMYEKMKEINDDFPVSTWYKENWVNKDNCIIKTATS